MSDRTGFRILVVEDEMLLVMMIEDMLLDLGCDAVIVASRTEQALKLIESERFDAALLDVNLHGEKSDRVADALLAQRIPFIFCTGGSLVDLAPKFRGRPVLRKPFSYDELSEMVAQLELAPH